MQINRDDVVAFFGEEKARELIADAEAISSATVWMCSAANARAGYTSEDIERLTREREGREAAYRARQKCRHCISWELRDRSEKLAVKGRCRQLLFDRRPNLYWEEEFGPNDSCADVYQGMTKRGEAVRERQIRRIESAKRRAKQPAQGNLFEAG